jgi:tetratricopeptide (TPR) repeat protein
MSDSLYQDILQVAHQMEWPPNRSIIPGSQAIYEQGLDLVNTYRGHPQVLLEALKIFQATNVLPYALAGLAATLIRASYESGKDFDEEGLKEAFRWMKHAQSMAGNRLEINFVEAWLYIDWKQPEKARQILDQLSMQEQGSANYFLAITEFYYWDRQNKIEKVQFWRDRAKVLAKNNNQHFYVQAMLSWYYLSNNMYVDYIKEAQQITMVAPADPWLWHNLSIAYIQLKIYPEAEKCNKKALELMEFGAARDIEKILKKRRSWW